MHITVSVVVIMFELTGALTYILPTMIVVGVTKAVGELFGKGGIADRMIWFNGFPFLDNKEEHNFGVPVSQVMTSDPVTLPTTGCTMADIEAILANSGFQGFPVVEERQAKILVGYIGRTELRYAVDRVKKHHGVLPTARCYFAAPASAASLAPATPSTPLTPAVTVDGSSSSVDFSRFVDPTPVSVHPRLPLETVMDMFRKIGPRVILIEYRGKVLGLVTVKDCLKYQFKAEAHETPRVDDRGIVEGQEEWLWGLIMRGAEWASDKVATVSRGRIRLNSDVMRRGSAPRRAGIMDGTEDVPDDGVELNRI
jgi:chloride channel 3/4/5